MTKLRALLARPDIVVAPGIYDMISLRVADDVGFGCLYMTGFGTVCSYAGQPDVGIVTFSEMLGRVQTFCRATATPVICDGDAGFGGLVNVAHAVRAYERAGAAAIQLDDRAVPTPAHTGRGQPVRPLKEMVRALRVALDSRATEDFLVVARTYARTSVDLDEALRRAEAYAQAGADILFVQSPQSEAELETIGKSFDTPLLVDMFEGLPTQPIGLQRLQEMGYSIVIYPGTGFCAAARALQDTYAAMQRGRWMEDVDHDGLYPISRLRTLMGYDDLRQFNERYAERDD
jgi:2-methylisocitrate lyase-like PEP mutase family enzyme